MIEDQSKEEKGESEFEIEGKLFQDVPSTFDATQDVALPHNLL